MKRWLAVLLTSTACFFAAWPSSADESTNKSSPWERYSANLGVFFATTSSSARLGGTSAGVEFDVEDTLGLSKGNNAFRIDAFWRFTDSRRHRVDFSWFSLNRSGSKVLTRDIEIDGTTFPTGSTVSSSLDLDIYKGAYSWSFFQDDRLDIAAEVGLYVAPMSLNIDASGIFQGSGSLDFTAPLPIVGLRMDVAITPKWYLRSGFDVFYLQVDDYEGYITDVRVAGEYKAFKNVGFGLGVEFLQLSVESEQSTSIPGVESSGKFEFDYAGVYTYMKVFFD